MKGCGESRMKEFLKWGGRLDMDSFPLQSEKSYAYDVSTILSWGWCWCSALALAQRCRRWAVRYVCVGVLGAGPAQAAELAHRCCVVHKLCCWAPMEFCWHGCEPEACQRRMGSVTGQGKADQWADQPGEGRGERTQPLGLILTPIPGLGSPVPGHYWLLGLATDI